MAEATGGSAGNNLYYVRSAGDLVVEAAAGGIDWVYSYLADYTLPANVENGRLVGGGARNLAGNALDNVLQAAPGNNILRGGAGIDTVSYRGATGVTVSLAQTTPQFTTGSGFDTLLGIENLTGSAGADLLSGHAGDNLLHGGAGADTLRGGDGNDTYVVDDAGDVVDETAPVSPLTVSARADGSRPLEGASRGIVSADGRFLLFSASSDDVVAGDGNGRSDGFLRDLLAGSVQLVAATAEGASAVDVSADGRHVVLLTYGRLAALDTDGSIDVYLKDMATGAVQQVSTDAAGAGGSGFTLAAALSPDARFVLFDSMYDSNLVPGVSGTDRHVFMKHVDTGVVQVIDSVDGVAGNAGAYGGAFAAGGRHVVFVSAADNLVAGDANGAEDVFVKDLQTGVVRLASSSSTGAQGDTYSTGAAISANGRFVVFHSSADGLVEGDTGVDQDIFRKDLATGTLTLVSASAASEHAEGESSGATISADGRFVVFYSDAANLVPGHGGLDDVFVKDMRTGAIACVSGLNEHPLTDAPNAASRISADGRFIVFESHHDNEVVMVRNPFLANTGVDTVRASVSHRLGASVENLVLTGTGAVNGTGNALANRMDGNGAANVLAGSAGADLLFGAGGADALRGGAGADRLAGSVGNDRFVFDVALSQAGVDTIADFSRRTGNADKIVLDDDVFTALGVTTKSGGVALPAARFHLGTAAADPLDRIVYDRSSGALWYDADGSGAGAAVQIAVVGTGTHPSLSAADFLVVA